MICITGSLSAVWDSTTGRTWCACAAHLKSRACNVVSPPHRSPSLPLRRPASSWASRNVFALLTAIEGKLRARLVNFIAVVPTAPLELLIACARRFEHTVACSADMATCVMEGYLRKSHKSQPWAKGNFRRFFRQEGNHVRYFVSETGKCAGGFDMRSLLFVRPSEEKRIKFGADFIFSDGSKMLISFEESPSEAEAWLTVWASTMASGSMLHPSLRSKRKAAYVNALARDFGSQGMYNCSWFQRQRVRLSSERSAPGAPELVKPAQTLSADFKPVQTLSVDLAHSCPKVRNLEKGTTDVDTSDGSDSAAPPADAQPGAQVGVQAGVQESAEPQATVAAVEEVLELSGEASPAAVWCSPDPRTDSSKSSKCDELSGESGKGEDTPSRSARGAVLLSPEMDGNMDDAEGLAGSASSWIPTNLIGSLSNHGCKYGSDGVPKTINQDRGCVTYPFAGDANMMLLCVFDGHGEVGEQVSEYMANTVPKLLEDDLDLLYSDMETALARALETADRKLVDDGVPCHTSGTTGVAVLVHGSTVWAANVGDSRAVVGRRANGKMVPVALTEDQKPDNPVEMERITRAGAHVTISSSFGAGRVWLPEAKGGYGLAMGRSLGDHVFRPFGVIPTPVVTRYELNPNDAWLVLASDGVWEFLSNEQSVKILDLHEHATEGCVELIRHAASAWLREEGSYYRDDITAIVTKLPLLPMSESVLQALGHHELSQRASHAEAPGHGEVEVTRPCGRASAEASNDGFAPDMPLVQRNVTLEYPRAVPIGGSVRTASESVSASSSANAQSKRPAAPTPNGRGATAVTRPLGTAPRKPAPKHVAQLASKTATAESFKNLSVAAKKTR